MTERKTYIKTVTWKAADTVMVVDIVKSGKGYVTEWWVSSNFDNNLQVVGHYNIPIYGYDVAEVERRASNLAGQDIPMFAVRTFGGESTISDAPSPSRKLEIARLHLVAHMEDMGGWALMERTAEMFKLIEQFRVKESAELIAEIEGVKVRAVHERIQRARREGLLPRKATA